MFLPPVSAASRAGALSVEGTLSALYVSHRRSVRPVHRVELVCSLYSWWAGLGSSLGHTAPGFQLWFYFHLYMWVMGFAPEASLEDLGLPLRARHGSGAAAWIAGVLAAPGTQKSWQLGQQEI